MSGSRSGDTRSGDRTRFHPEAFRRAWLTSPVPLGRRHGYRSRWGRDAECPAVGQATRGPGVATPTEWPGATAVPGLVGDMELEGTWYDRDHETRARRRGRAPEPDAFAHRYVVRLATIPPWAHLSPSELQQRHAALVRDIEAEHEGREAPVLGRDAVQAEDPHAGPASSKRRPAPVCHTTHVALRDGFRAALRLFVTAYRAAAAVLRGDASPGSGTALVSTRKLSAEHGSRRRSRWAAAMATARAGAGMLNVRQSVRRHAVRGARRGATEHAENDVSSRRTWPQEEALLDRANGRLVDDAGMEPTQRVPHELAIGMPWVSRGEPSKVVPLPDNCDRMSDACPAIGQVTR